MKARFIKYVVQSMLGMIGFSVYVLADTLFISKSCGAEGLAVLNLILPVFGIMYALGALVGIGSATVYGIRKAENKNTDGYFFEALCWNLILSIPYFLVGAFIPRQVLTLLGADTELVKIGYGYLRIVLMGAPLFMCNYTITAFVRNDNASSIAMTGALVGSAFNTIFDYIFIFTLNMGFTGAALATICSPVSSMAVCMIHLLGNKNRIAFRKKAPSIKFLIKSGSLGMSFAIGEISSSMITLVFNMLILKEAGNIGVAAYGVVANTSIVGMSLFNGIAQGIQPMVSEKYGMGRKKEVSTLLKYGILITIFVEIAVVSIVWLNTDGIIAIFNSENNMELLKYAHDGMRLYFLGFLIAGINILFIAYFSATDKAKPVLIGSLSRGIVSIVTCSVVLSILFGMNGIWISFLISEIITAILLITVSLKRKKDNTVSV